MASEFPANDPGAPFTFDSLPVHLPDWVQDGQAQLTLEEHPALLTSEGNVASGSIGKVGAVRVRVQAANECILWLTRLLGTPLSHDVRSTDVNGRAYRLATIRFDSGSVAHVEIDPQSPGLAFEVCGSEGMISFDIAASGGLRANSVPVAPASEPRLLPLDVRTLEAAIQLKQILSS